MATDSALRKVSIERTAPSEFLLTNSGGGQVTINTGEGSGFTPVELLLAAIGGCTAIDVDILTSRRAEPQSFTVDVEATKVRDGDGNHLADIEVIFKVVFPDGEAGDAARAILPDAVRKSHERLCTVGRTVQLGAAIATKIE